MIIIIPSLTTWYMLSVISISQGLLTWAAQILLCRLLSTARKKHPLSYPFDNLLMFHEISVGLPAQLNILLRRVQGLTLLNSASMMLGCFDFTRNIAEI